MPETFSTLPIPTLLNPSEDRDEAHDDFLDELPALDHPLEGEGAGDSDGSVDDEDIEIQDVDEREDLRDDSVDTRTFEAELDTLREEPSVLGDDDEGLEHDVDQGVEDLAGPSFVGPEELALDHDDDGLDDEAPLGEDDGGVEGFIEHGDEVLDELPPLDGQDDDEDLDDELSDLLVAELAPTPASSQRETNS